MRSRPVVPSFRAVRTQKGYTLVEILVAVTLTLILMTAVVRVFGGVGDGISKARQAVEMTDRLRIASQLLGSDLRGVTFKGVPPARLEEAPGYLELIDASQSAGQAGNDNTIGKLGCVLMFTTRSAGRPFMGLCATGNGGTLQSNIAEVAWFLRGHNLHRRVLLVAPGIGQQAFNSNWYASNDISVHKAGSYLVPNSLADLTKREYRFGHDARSFPFDARGWGQLGLPTVGECCSNWMSGWQNGSTPPPSSGSVGQDLWSSSAANDAFLGTAQSRASDDLVLTNCIGFGVQVWDPTSGAYVDLGSGGGRLSGAGAQQSQLTGPPYVWDSGCFSYENEGLYSLDANGNPQPGNTAGGKGTDGLDNDGDGVVDGKGEQIYSPPYPAPLRGIQIQIRAFDPSSGQVRAVTVEQDFLPK